MNNEITIHTANQTPIEIALGIDDEGMTTAKKLYEFLELDASNYSRWSRKHILNNPYAEENVDFWAFVTNDEWGGQATTDYKLTATFAKKLSMMTKSLKGEQARQYFIGTEAALKKVAERKADEITKLKADYYDMACMWRESQKELLMIRKQMEALEQRQDKKDEQQYERTYEERRAKGFFNSIVQVLRSDEHSIAIKPKRYRGSLTLVGIYDDEHIYLGKEMAYNIYEQYSKNPLKPKLLWEVLTQTGYVDIMVDIPRKMMIGWCSQAPLVLYRNKVEFLIVDKE